MNRKIGIVIACVLTALGGASWSGVALAKLPPLSEEAKAKAAEAKAKADWSGKVAAYQLCRAQDRAAAAYSASMKQQGKEAKPGMAGAAACADPGPYVAAATAGGPATAPIAAPSEAKPAAAPATVQSGVKKP
jgi:phage protein D